MMTDGFLAEIRTWFEDRFEAPSPAQEVAWPVIQRGESMLLTAPTGSGKTLAAFLCAIDRLYRKLDGEPDLPGVQVLYVTPLKALGNDIHRNLTVPLQEIAEIAERKMPEIRVGIRSGDTPQNERQRMVRTPPHILITTPESLYLMLGSQQMKPALSRVRTVIVDEIHAMCTSKRGTHLALSLERLDALAGHPIQRLGISATVNPLETVAHFLAGCREDGSSRPCTIVDAGMRKDLDVQVVAPVADFVSVGHDALWANAYERLVGEIRSHRTTLIFCNSRYRAERTVLRLNELGGDELRIGVHHGSMAKEIRLQAEEDLRSGRLDALVATSSLELGIDVGSIDLVYQLESPKTVASGLQRIGRAGHLLHATSKGRILVFERDELFEAGALCRAMLHGEIDPVGIPTGCLDVLAQQVAGCTVQQTWQADALFRLVRGSYPFRELSPDTFHDVLRMVAGEHGLEMPQAPRALVYWDRSVGTVAPTRGAPSITATCVGTISESSEYDVIIDDGRKRIGRVDATFVDDTLRTGDVFVLGSNTWKVLSKRKNQLFVEAAPTTTPTVPWWMGPIVPRSPQLGQDVGRLREYISAHLDDPALPETLRADFCLDAQAVEAITGYVREQQLTGIVPNHQNLLVESWRDELGRANIILHSPLGARVNRTLGLVLQECMRTARENWTCTANNDLILLTYTGKERQSGITARALLESLDQKTIDAYSGTLLADSCMGGAAFREVAVCALQILRAHKNKRVPLWLQNHRAEELYECSRRHPEYPVLQEVVRNYVGESLDIPRLRELIADIAAGRISIEFRDVECPSPFAHGLLVHSMYSSDHQMGRDRRAHLLRLHRRILEDVLTSDQMAELLDARAIAWLEDRLGRTSDGGRARDVEELAHALREIGDVPAAMEHLRTMVEGDAAVFLRELFETGRVVGFRIPGEEGSLLRLVPAELWTEYLGAYHPVPATRDKKVLVPILGPDGDLFFEARGMTVVLPKTIRTEVPTAEARSRIIARFLRNHGPVSLYELMNRTGWPENELRHILGGLVAEGNVLEGVYRPDLPRPQWVNRTNLEEIHRLTLKFLHRELEACAPYEVVDFVTRWQHRHPETRLSGVDGVREVISQLQGQEIVQGAWEPELLACRVADYEPEMLDRLFETGEVCWRRVGAGALRGKLTLCLRRDMPWLSAMTRKVFGRPSDVDISEAAEATREFFRTQRSGFFVELLEATGIDEGVAMRCVWTLAWKGELATDRFETVRHCGFQTTLSDCYDLMNTSGKIVRGRASADDVIKRMKLRSMDPRVGRWWATERLPAGTERSCPDEDETIRKWTQLLLKRWGILTREIVSQAESTGPEWRHLQKELKRLELLGLVARGYFIEDHHGEQYGLPEAVELLRDCRARRSVGAELGFLPRERLFCISSRDTANLYSNCLPVIEERGEAFRTAMKSGNLHNRVILQAGQALMFESSGHIRVLNVLDREQVETCVTILRDDYRKFDVTMRVNNWNGHPIDVSPASGIFWAQGFRFDGRNWFCYPPVKTRKAMEKPRIRIPDVFHPYYVEKAPATYDRDWLIGRAAEALRENFRAVFSLLDELLPADARMHYGGSGFTVRYHDQPLIRPHLTSGRIYLNVSHKGWRPPVVVTAETEVAGEGFRQELSGRINRCVKAIDEMPG